MEAKDTDIKMLLTYFKDNPDILADTLDSLKKDAHVLDDGGLISTNKNNGVFLNLTKADKKWFVFSQYGIHFKPIYFKTSSNQEVAEVTIDNKKQGKLKENEEKTFGPFLPVEHKIIGIYKGPYGTVEVYETIDPADYPERKIMVELDASGNNISLDSNYDEATVFINGESTGKTVKDLDSLGPVSTDGSVKVECVNGNQATASFEMVSRDYTPNRDILVQTWAGKWHISKENSFWKLDDPEISKINERLE